LPWQIADALQIGVGVLDDEALHLVRVLGEQPKPDGAAVVLHVKDIGLDAELVDQSRDMSCQVVETVLEVLGRRRVGLAEADIVRRDHVEPVGQARDQVPVHMAAGREPVQQQDRGARGVSRLAVEDLATLDGREMIGGRMHGRGFLGRGGVRAIGIWTGARRRWVCRGDFRRRCAP
jgi:hypothetical protein